MFVPPFTSAFPSQQFHGKLSIIFRDFCQFACLFVFCLFKNPQSRSSYIYGHIFFNMFLAVFKLLPLLFLKKNVDNPHPLVFFSIDRQFKNSLPFCFIFPLLFS